MCMHICIYIHTYTSLRCGRPGGLSVCIDRFSPARLCVCECGATSATEHSLPHPPTGAPRVRSHSDTQLANGRRPCPAPSRQSIEQLPVLISIVNAVLGRFGRASRACILSSRVRGCRSLSVIEAAARCPRLSSSISGGSAQSVAAQCGLY